MSFEEIIFQLSTTSIVYEHTTKCSKIRYILYEEKITPPFRWILSVDSLNALSADLIRQSSAAGKIRRRLFTFIERRNKRRTMSSRDLTKSVSVILFSWLHNKKIGTTASTWPLDGFLDNGASSWYTICRQIRMDAINFSERVPCSSLRVIYVRFRGRIAVST